MNSHLTRAGHTFCLSLCLGAFPLAIHAADQPNILWITSEDNGPHLGCYGDTYAVTPNLDALAAKSLRYLNVWSTAPVCAPARTAIISGVYPTSLGAEHMRSLVSLPPQMKMYPQFLREAGYYCSNNSKEDYNLREPGQVWDESSNKAHWKNREPGQPFFAIFNHTVSHESQIRKRPHTPVHDPALVRVPAYHPDTPEVRQDWAQYYDKITEMDAKAGENLKELEEAGLADNTIVFYYGDHGSGMPRNKRWPYNSGLRVPLLVHIPEKFKDLAPEDYRPGQTTDRLVSFVDLAPTVLSLAGIQPPNWMQGRAFLGPHEGPPHTHLHGFRGRMDERYDLVRSVRDKRYVYIRNFMPHKIYGQHIDYMFQTPTTRVWKQLYDEGKLEPPQTHFWETKPAEELYDLETDPDETRNLADSPEHRRILLQLRRAQHDHALRIRDVGFLPEDEIHSRSGKDSPYAMAQSDDKFNPTRVVRIAEAASMFHVTSFQLLESGLVDKDSAVRYWAALGCLMRGELGVKDHRKRLRDALRDPSPSVRIIAAEALGRYGEPEDLKPALDVLMNSASLGDNSVYVSMLALNAIDALGDKAADRREAIQALPDKGGGAEGRTSSYVPRLLEDIRANLPNP